MFEKAVTCQGGVEFWLNILLNTVKSTVQQVIAAQSQCFVDPEYNFVIGFQQFCGQVYFRLMMTLSFKVDKSTEL